MNIKVTIVILLGLVAIAVLYVYPPWRAHGDYVGHIRADRVRWLVFDTTRFYIEVSLIVLVMVIGVVKVWARKKGRGVIKK